MERTEQKMDLLTVPGQVGASGSQDEETGSTPKRKFSHKWSIVSAMSYFSDVSDDYVVGGSTFGRAGRTCRRSRACCVTLYAWAVLFLVACLATVVIVTAYVGMPYLHASTYLTTTCSVSRATYAGKTWACSCGKGCRSEYPCLRISVTFLDDVTNSTYPSDNETENMIAGNEVELHRQCSFYPPCKSSRAANEKAVRDYEMKYGQKGQKFSCLYNPENPNEVIRTRRFHLNHVIHGLVWSSVAFLFSLTVLICAIKRKGCDFL